ncbi:hypothetical protein ARD30_08420 [Bosea thiooxidans]|uniref:Uncharacterized protein n=1 Tax=Bosea thiooxidans TaxID=53254 RepID=A0A0Q3IAM4_9HYPH|nr:hypothetical protein [Bosea thiooxidans]KQK32008.1 hypothetical protein ARD30_08420 [Bosea thiooxidans]
MLTVPAENALQFEARINPSDIRQIVFGRPTVIQADIAAAAEPLRSAPAIGPTLPSAFEFWRRALRHVANGEVYPQIDPAFAGLRVGSRVSI